MGAGVSQQVLNRAALTRLRKLQAEFNSQSYAKAVYKRATAGRYGEVVFPCGGRASVNVIRASNGDCVMRLTVKQPGGEWTVRALGDRYDDLAFTKITLHTGGLGSLIAKMKEND